MRITRVADTEHARGGRDDLPPISAIPATPRRLQRMGAVTVGISLPRDWVGDRGLAPGRSVYLSTLADGTILVRDHLEAQTPAPVSVSVRSDAPPEHLFRQLIATYLEGAPEIVIEQPSGLSDETVAVVKTFLRRTVQSEIVSQEFDRITIRDVSRGADLPLGALLRRLFSIVLELHHSASRSLSAGRPAEGEIVLESPWADQDDEVDRYAWLIERIVRLQISSRPAGALISPREPDPVSSLLAARYLERVADHAVGIAEQGTRLNQAAVPGLILRPIATLHLQVLELLPRAFEVIESPSVERANEVIDAAEAQHVASTTLFERFLTSRERTTLTPLVATSIGSVLQSIDRTVAYTQNLAEIGLDQICGNETARRESTSAGRRSASTSLRSGVSDGTGVPRPVHGSFASRPPSGRTPPLSGA